MTVNRREAIAITAAAGVAPASLASAAVASTAEPARELIRFPEPDVNKKIKAIEGLSNPAWFLRQAMLDLLDTYRAIEEDSALRDQPVRFSEDYHARIEAVTRPMGALRTMARWTRARGAPDRTLRKLICDLGLCPSSFQVPHPDDIARLRAQQERANKRARQASV